MQSYEMPLGGDGTDIVLNNTFVRGRASDGGVIVEEMTRDQWMERQVPPRAEYRLRITGFAEPFETRNMFKGAIDQNGKTDERDTITKTKIDFQIVRRDGSLGASVLIWCNWPKRLSVNSNLGKLYFAATANKEVAANGRADVLDMIAAEGGGDVKALLMPSRTLNNEGRPMYAECVWDSVSPWIDAPDGDDDASLWQ